MSEWAAGVYEGTIVGTASGSASTGTPWFDVRFNIGGHEKAVRWYFSEKSADRSLKELATLGFNKDFEAPEFSVQGPVRLRLEYEPFTRKNGTTVNQERWRLDSAGAPLERDQLMRLNAMARAMSGNGVPPPPAPPGRPAAPPMVGKAPIASAASGGVPGGATATMTAPPPVAAPEKKVKQISPCTRDQAWKLINEPAAWNVSVEAVMKATGRQEAEFTEMDWGAVVAETVPW